MKKEITYEKALKELKRGKAVVCQTGTREDKKETVHDVQRLDYLYNLSKQGMQLCKMFLIQKPKQDNSEENIYISFDEAYEMLYSGQPVYYNQEKEEEVIRTISDLIQVNRSFSLKGQQLLLYWHE